MAHVPLVSHLVGGDEDPLHVLGHAGQPAHRAPPGDLRHQLFAPEASLARHLLEDAVHEGQHPLADLVGERDREGGLDARGAAGDDGDGPRGRDGGDRRVPERSVVAVDGAREVRKRSRAPRPAWRTRRGPPVCKAAISRSASASACSESYGMPRRKSRSAQPMIAEADATVRLHHRVDLGQGIRIALDHVVEEAHRGANHLLES